MTWQQAATIQIQHAAEQKGKNRTENGEKKAVESSKGQQIDISVAYKI